MSTQTKLLKVFEGYDENVVEKAYKAFAKQNEKKNGKVNGRTNGKTEAAPQMEDTHSYMNGYSMDEIAATGLTIHDVEDPGEPVHEGEDGCISMEAMPALERIIGESNFLPAHFLEEGAMVQRSVGRIAFKVPLGGFPLGTGFMVSPTLLMTNNHVIPTKSLAGRVEVQFNYQLDYQGLPQTVDTYQFDANKFFYTNASLDFTLIYVKPKCNFRLPVAQTGGVTMNVAGSEMRAFSIDAGMLPAEMPLAARPILPPFPPFLCQTAGIVWGHLQLPTITRYCKDQRVNIVQHPDGRRKEVSLQDNVIQHVFRKHIRYITDTQRGSSGSPVFNNSWDLIALHHAGGEQAADGTWINNQGVRIDRIVQDIRNSVDTAVRNQLGL